MAAARAEAGPRGVADASEAASAVVDSVGQLVAERNLQLTVDDAKSLRLGIDRDLAERILHPVLDNACRYGRKRVRLSIARANGSVTFTIADDGPGVSPEEVDSIFEPAIRGAAGRGVGTSAGLGLALARRLARSVEGDVEAEQSAEGGRFIVRLPSA